MLSRNPRVEIQIAQLGWRFLSLDIAAAFLYYRNHLKVKDTFDGPAMF